MRSNLQRQKLAGLLSSSGALVLGLGLGLMLPEVVRPFAESVLAVGAVAHAWGMFETHRLERAPHSAPPRWENVLYWVCWLVLVAVAVLIVARLLGSR
jgi:hypothetical protein